MTAAGFSTREQVAEIIKAQLREVGIEVCVDLRPASVLIGTIIRHRQFPHMALWSTLFSPESTGYEGFHSSQIPSEANGWEGFNSMGWRIRLLRRQQEVFAEDLPALPLDFVPALTTARRALRGIRPTGLFGSFITWNAYEWSWQE